MGHLSPNSQRLLSFNNAVAKARQEHGEARHRLVASAVRSGLERHPTTYGIRRLMTLSIQNDLALSEALLRIVQTHLRSPRKGRP